MTRSYSRKDDITIADDYDKCAAVALKVGTWMKDSVTVFQSKKTGKFYFRLSKDPREIIESDVLGATTYGYRKSRILPNSPPNSLN